MSLLVHHQTKQRLETFVAAPSHAVLLVGPRGSGKSSLARQLIEQLLDLPEHGLEHYGYKLQISPVDGKAIGIEEIRELEHFLSLKVPGTSAVDRAVIIEDSQLMTTEAQNALLKVLEEPPAGTILLLTTTNSQALLPTVRSRTQVIDVMTPDRQELESYFTTQGFDLSAVSRLRALSGGLPGLMSSLLQDDEHPLRAATDMARQLLSQSSYERLLLVDELAKQRPLLADTLFILQQMAQVSLRTATGPAARKWQKVLEAAYEASEKLGQSGQPKLILTNLMLAL